MNCSNQLYIRWLSIHGQVSFPLWVQVLTTLQWLVKPSEAVCTHSILIENDLKYSCPNSVPTLCRLVSIPVFQNFWIYVNVLILQSQAVLSQINICLDNYPEKSILVVLLNLLLGEVFAPLPYSSNTVYVHVNLPSFGYLSHKLSKSQYVLVLFFHCLAWLVPQPEFKFSISHCMNFISSYDFDNRLRIIVSENRYFRLRETFEIAIQS